MGRYIDDILQPGEKVLYSSNLHWVVYVPAIAAWIVSAALLVLTRYAVNETLVLLCLASSAVVAFAALYWSMKGWFQRWTTETDVTTLRVVHKEGFIQRETFEMNLDRVESVDVSQSIVGRLLGYGNVTIRGVGDSTKPVSYTHLTLPTIYSV